MCGRYSLHQKAKEIARRFEASPMPDDIKPNYNAAPGQHLPVVTENEDGRRLEVMKWGLIPVWAKDPNIGYKMINARAESIFDKPAWRTVILKKRCLIPANGFFEWDKIIGKAGRTQKQPYYIHPKQDDLFAFAGVWETWKDVEGLEWKTYSIITTEANKDVGRIHDRMPVILHQEDEASWLTPSHNDDRSAIEALLRPYEDGGLDMFEVSRDVNTTKNNDEHLIYPLNAQ